MKKGGEKLHLHYQQAFDYWLNAVPNRPRYVILCNFNEFWIYDFDRQLHDPVDVVALKDLPARYTALNFLFPDERKPVFNNDREDVSRKTADDMASLFKALTRRKKNPIGTSGARLSADQAHEPQLTLWPEKRNPTANLSNRESNSFSLTRAQAMRGAGSAGNGEP